MGKSYSMPSTESKLVLGTMVKGFILGEKKKKRKENKTAPLQMFLFPLRPSSSIKYLETFFTYPQMFP